MNEETGGGASHTTDPAFGSSTATDVSLREYLTALITASERRADQRFATMREMVEAAFESSKMAIDKADAATEKRFESVNEFRAQLTDQATRFVTKEAMDALADKLAFQISRSREDLDALAKRIDLREGQSVGSRLTTGVVVTVITVALGVIGTIVVLANFAASR